MINKRGTSSLRMAHWRAAKSVAAVHLSAAHIPDGIRRRQGYDQDGGLDGLRNPNGTTVQTSGRLRSSRQ